MNFQYMQIHLHLHQCQGHRLLHDRQEQHFFRDLHHHLIHRYRMNLGEHHHCYQPLQHHHQRNIHFHRRQYQTEQNNLYLLHHFHLRLLRYQHCRQVHQHLHRLHQYYHHQVPIVRQDFQIHQRENLVVVQNQDCSVRFHQQHHRQIHQVIHLDHRHHHLRHHRLKRFDRNQLYLVHLDPVLHYQRLHRRRQYRLDKHQV